MPVQFRENILMGKSPKVGGHYRISYKGQILYGTVDHIATVRSGAVLAWLKEYPHKGIPVTVYATWFPD